MHQVCHQTGGALADSNGVFKHCILKDFLVLIDHNTLLFIYKNVVFPALSEYSYFYVDVVFGRFVRREAPYFLFRIYWGINYKCLVSRSVSRYIMHVLHSFSLQSTMQDVTSNETHLAVLALKKAFRTEIA